MATPKRITKSITSEELRVAKIPVIVSLGFVNTSQEETLWIFPKATAKEIKKMDSKSAKWIASDAIQELTSKEVQERLQGKK